MLDDETAGGTGDTNAAADAGATNAAKPGETPAGDANGASGGTAAAAGASATAGETAGTVVPETYVLTPKDGVPLDAALLDTTAATARTLGLSQESAQTLLDHVTDQIAAARVTTREEVINDFKLGGAEWQKQAESWEAAALADTEIGGSQEKLDANVALAQKVFGTFGSKEVNDFLRETGFGSNPIVIRMFSKIGKAMSEGSLVKGEIPPANSGSKDPAETLYGKSQTTKE